MGGAGRAGVETTEIMFLNPTAVALGKGFEAGFIFSDGYQARQEHSTGMAVALVENDPENFAPGGFAYVQKRQTRSGVAWDERYFFGALATPVSSVLTLGISFYHLDQGIDGGDSYRHINGALGALVTLDEGLGVAYVVSNLVKPDDDTPLALRPIMQQSLGVSWMVPKLMRLTLDLTRWEKQNADKKGIIQAGSEMKVAPFALLRFGVEVDDIVKRNTGTLGIGFLGPRLRANYSFSKPFEGTNGAMHSVDMRLPF